MKKTKKRLDKATIMTKPTYKFSKWITSFNPIILCIIAAVLSLILGLMSNKCSEVIKNLINGKAGMNDVLITYIIINILYSIVTNITTICRKGAKLQIINSEYRRLFGHVYHSKVSDISKIGIAKIESTSGQLAILNSLLKTETLMSINVLTPFVITMIKVSQCNPIITLIMGIIMIIAIILSLNCDKIFHFDEAHAELKGNLQTITLSNYLCVNMLKYMGTYDFAQKRLKEAQDIALPAMHNSGSSMWQMLTSLLYNSPVIFAFWAAIQKEDYGLIAYIAINEWSISAVINWSITITEYISERHGCLQVLKDLKADDIPVNEKPPMPETLTLKGVEFTYPSDTDKRHRFIISDFTIEKGKRYRFSGPSGSGKSSFFKYFAGEMQANKELDCRVFYIHQKSELLAGSVRDNICLGNKWVPDPVIESLIREIRLGQWFDALPDGLDTQIGDAGLEPSGGEASRISLLRLFIHLRNYDKDGNHPINNEIIILDEVTSALDKRDVFINDDEYSTEEAVIKMIEKETRGSTLFIISHEDINSSAFGFKDITDVQMTIVNEQIEDGKIIHKLV